MIRKIIGWCIIANILPAIVITVNFIAPYVEVVDESLYMSRHPFIFAYGLEAFLVMIGLLLYAALKLLKFL